MTCCVCKPVDDDAEDDEPVSWIVHDEKASSSKRVSEFYKAKEARFAAAELQAEAELEVLRKTKYDIEIHIDTEPAAAPELHRSDTGTPLDPVTGTPLTGGLLSLGVVLKLGKWKKMIHTIVDDGPTDKEISRGLRFDKQYDFFDPHSVTQKMRARNLRAKHYHQRRVARRVGAALKGGVNLADINWDEEEEDEEDEEEEDEDDARSDGSANSGGSVRSNGSQRSVGSNGSQGSNRSNGSGKGKRNSKGSRRASKGERTSSSSKGKRSSTTVNSRDYRVSIHGGATIKEGGKLRFSRVKTNTNFHKVSGWGVIVGKVLHAQNIGFEKLTETAAARFKLQRRLADKGTLVGSTVRARAEMVVRQAKELCKHVGQEHDILDSDWRKLNTIKLLFGSEYTDNLMFVFKAAEKVLSVEPALAEAHVPCRVFGDTHGQLRDLLLLFYCYGFPDAEEGPHFVFNGDFVDRGSHQVEVIGLLLALKVAMPNKIVLVRGNHEDEEMNKRYGFRDACVQSLGSGMGKKIFEMSQKVFNMLPFACLIYKKVLVVHGGIGDGAWSLTDLKSVHKPVTAAALSQPSSVWLSDILWSDPIEDDHEEMEDYFGVHPSPRGGKAKHFAWDVTKTFCARNGLALVVRSHQSKRAGYGFGILHDEHMVRVFSARDYEGHGNDGAVLLFTKDRDESMTKGLKVRAQVVAALTKSKRVTDRTLNEFFQRK